MEVKKVGQVNPRWLWFNCWRKNKRTSEEQLRRRDEKGKIDRKMEKRSRREVYSNTMLRDETGQRMEKRQSSAH